MSTMTAQTPATTMDDRPDVTWRDAATPLSRASRRRWTACYVLLLMLLAAAVIDDAFAINEDDGADLPLIMFIAVPVVFGMLRRGTRRITALDHPALDERDIDARNSAYRVAFPLLVLVILASLVLLGAFGLDETQRNTRLGENAVLTESLSVVDPKALIGLGLWIALWAAFLPTGALAWREPDALELESEDGGRGLRESVRDAVLGVTLAAGVMVSLISEGDSPALLFVAALAVAGALGRRALGQPAMSRQRKWRVAIGLMLIAILVVAALLSSSSGGGGG